MLTQQHRQEAMSRSYISVIAGRCGLGCSYRDFDYGIDLTVHSIGRRDKRFIETGYKLDIQAKSTTSASLSDTHARYDMEVQAYDDLRDPEVGCPRILVLLVLPEAEAEWSSQTEEQLLLRRCAYWFSLRGMGPTTNKKTVRVAVPRANVFSVEALLELMDKVRKGEGP